MLKLLAVRVRRRPRSRQRRDSIGGSLIEVLVALLLVAFGFLGIGALFNYSISANKSASSRLVATMLMQDYADLARANPTGFANNSYNQNFATYDPEAKAVNTLDPANLCSYPNCNSTGAANNDRELFSQRVRALLPAGVFVATRVTTGNTRAMDIWILWVEGKNVQDTNTSIDVCPAGLLSQSPVPDPYPRCMHARIAL